MDNDIAELVRASLMTSPEGSPMSKTHILYTIYLMKANLPEGNRLVDTLQFYWYKQGPYSQNISDTINKMECCALLLASQHLETKQYRLDHNLDKPQVQHDGDMQEAVSVMTETVRQFPGLRQRTDEIYKNAPYEWYRTYNTEFMNAFKKYQTNITRNSVSNLEPPNTETLLESLEGTEYTAPHTQEFFDIRLAHNGFCRICNEVLATEHTRKDIGIIKELMSLCIELWNIFAYKVRILHHDGRYDGKIDSWNNKYNKELRNLKEKLECAERIHGVMPHHTVPKYIKDGNVASVGSYKDNSVTPAEFRRMLDDLTV